jgi:peroxiredoxin
VVLVDVDEGEAEIARFVERYGIELPLLRDPEGKVFREVGGRGLPMNLVWSKGERTTDIAPRSEAEWRKHLDALGCGASSRTR